MNIVVKIKGVDDFGREHITGNQYRYSHHYPRVYQGDFLLYFYPETRAVGIYQVQAETEHYKDVEDFQYCSGTMLRSEQQPAEFVEELRKTRPSTAQGLEDKILEVVDKYFPAVKAA